MPDMKEVSICIPNYNGGSYLIETIMSLKKQSYSNITITVFDNASEDNSLERLASLKTKNSRLKVIESSENIGAEANFTRCLNGAEGYYTAIFHSDDTYEPNIVLEAYKQLEKNSDVLAVATHSKIINAKGHVTGQRFVPPELKKSNYTLIKKGQLLPLVLKYGNFITCPSVVARSYVYKEIIKKWNGQEYKSSADLDVWLRINKIGPIVFINKPLMSYRESIASLSFNVATKRTSSHDIFLVLEEAIKSNESLTTSDLKNYEFLKFKDISLRSFNIIRNRQNVSFPRYNCRLKDVIQCAPQSLFHLKYFTLGSLIFLLRLVFRRWVRKIIFPKKQK